MIKVIKKLFKEDNDTELIELKRSITEINDKLDIIQNPVNSDFLNEADIVRVLDVVYSELINLLSCKNAPDSEEKMKGLVYAFMTNFYDHCYNSSRTYVKSQRFINSNYIILRMIFLLIRKNIKDNFSLDVKSSDDFVSMFTDLILKNIEEYLDTHNNKNLGDFDSLMEKESMIKLYNILSESTKITIKILNSNINIILENMTMSSKKSKTFKETYISHFGRDHLEARYILESDEESEEDKFYKMRINYVKSIGEKSGVLSKNRFLEMSVICYLIN